MLNQRPARLPQLGDLGTISQVPQPRPICLLSCLSKLFEKCVLTRFNTYLRIQERIPSHQFGFREKHGTIEQVNRITSEIRNAFENREYCTAKFIDVSQHLIKFG